MPAWQWRRLLRPRLVGLEHPAELETASRPVPHLTRDSAHSPSGLARGARQGTRSIYGSQHSEVHRVHLSRDCQSVRGRASIPRTLCLLHTEVGVMARSPISLDIKHKEYTGEYEIDRGVLHIFFEGQSKSSAVTGPSPELLARLLLIELVFQAPSWHASDTRFLGGNHS